MWGPVCVALGHTDRTWCLGSLIGWPEAEPCREVQSFPGWRFSDSVNLVSFYFDLVQLITQVKKLMEILTISK